MTNLTKENAFDGANISKNDVAMVIVKVNEKSFYATTDPYELYLDKLKAAKSHKITFKDFCIKENIKMYKYEGFLIEEGQKVPTRKITKALFNRHVHNTLKLHYERMLRTGSKVEVMHYEDVQATILATKDGICLISFDGAFYLYDIMSGDYRYIEEVSKGDLNSKNIDWSMSA